MICGKVNAGVKGGVEEMQNVISILRGSLHGS